MEDDEPLRLLLAGVLQEEGYRVTAVEGGVAALEYVRCVDPDLVLLDLTMRGMNGRQFLLTWAAEMVQPLSPVLVLTARTDYEREIAGLNVTSVLTKPFQLDELLDTIRRLSATTTRDVASRWPASYQPSSRGKEG